MKKAPQTAVRVSKDTLTKIKKMAGRENRSAANYIETLIEREYKTLEEAKMENYYWDGLVKNARKYDDYETFRAEVGWQDWMEEFLPEDRQDDGKEISESEAAPIERILRDAFEASR